MKYVIIGNSAAACGAVEAIRKIDGSSPITLISSEPHHIYGRPLISYLLSGKTTEEKMKYRPSDFYEKNGVDAKLGATVTSVDAEKKRITVNAAGKTFNEDYDRLLYACGSSPFVPPTEGLDKVKEKFTFMTLDDARSLGMSCDRDKKVLIIGAGLIGLKCAEGILGRCGDITVVDMAPRVLSSILDDECAAVVQSHIEKTGIRFILGDAVEKYESNKAFLRSGGELDFDILVTAVGVRANTKLLCDAGAKCGRGILTDADSRTSLTDIWAAGDCAESFDITAGGCRVLAILPNAYMQGEAAGYSMAGAPRPFTKAIPMNSIGFMGLHMITAGSYTGALIDKSSGGSIKKLYASGNHLIGFIMIGDVSRAGIYTALIREQTPLDTIDFELIAEKPQLMAFTAAQRASKLAMSH
ncbi:MAG: FAD-dependent oxidoreductase [Eubacteriales bacterium]